MYIGAGAYAGCAYCTHLGEYSKPLTKMVYPGNRCFLSMGDPLRQDAQSFPKKEVDLVQPPQLKTASYVLKASDAFRTAKTAAEQKRICQKTGCKGVSVLCKVDGFDRFLSTPVDPMHLVKDIVEHCVNLLSGREDSTNS